MMTRLLIAALVATLLGCGFASAQVGGSGPGSVLFQLLADFF